MADTCVLLSAVRNEGPDLLEWVAYHRLIGFASIVIYSNDCTDGSDILLDALASLGWITHHRHTRSPDITPQDAVAAMALRDPQISGADWVLWLDADEFLAVSTGQGQISDLTTAAGPADAIAINWRNFGDSGQTHSADALVLDTFTTAAPLKVRMSRTVKTLFRMGEKVASLFIHRPIWHPGPVSVLAGDGQPLNDDFTFGIKKNARPAELVPKKRQSYHLAQINHYPIKALDRVAAKQQRGNGLVIGLGSGRFGFSYLRRFNHNDEADHKIQRHLPALRGMIASALAEPEVSRAHVACRAKFAALLDQVRPITLALAADRTGDSAGDDSED